MVLRSKRATPNDSRLVLRCQVRNLQFSAFSTDSHNYASAGQYTVTVTLTDGTGIDTEQTVVNVYARDNGLRFDGNFDSVDEGTPFEFSLIDTINDPFAPPPIIEDISSWTINWGDSIEVINGNPASVTHVYADDDNLDFDFPGARRITCGGHRLERHFFCLERRL